MAARATVEDEAVRHAETADSLSMTFLHLLEKLSPVERAVFLLREVFDYDYEEVSRILRKTGERAADPRPRTRAHPGWKAPLRGVAGGAGRGRAALPRGLGGGRHGRARGAELPHATIYGDAVAMRWLSRCRSSAPSRSRRRSSAGDGKALERGFTYRSTRVNGEPGVVFYKPGGRARWVAAFEIADGVVVAVRSVLNPDKLTHVPPSSV